MLNFMRSVSTHVSEIEIIKSLGGMCGKLRSPTSDLNIDHCEE